MRKCDEEPESSSASLAQSDRSRDYPLNFAGNSPGTKATEDLEMRKCDEEPESSSASLAQSDRSREYPLNFAGNSPGTKTHTTLSPHGSASSQQQLDALKVFESRATMFRKHALKFYKGLLHEDEQDVSDDELSGCDDETCQAALKIAFRFLGTMTGDEQAHTLERRHHGQLFMYQCKLKSFMRTKHGSLPEVMDSHQWPVPLQKIYTELYLLEGDSSEVNNEHEVRLIETAFSRQRSLETLIKCEDIFTPLPKQQREPIRSVLTKGIAGIGKTVLAQKFMLDWAEEKANQDIQLMFSLPFRQLNLMRKQKVSLMELLNRFSPGLEESGIRDLSDYKVLFVLDGLDECRLKLDFMNNDRCCDASHPTSVDTLLTNLIVGNLLPNGRMWITSRPAAAGCIPARFVDRVTEIRGFNNLQKEQYFHRRIQDENLAKTVIANIKSTRSLYIMCHVPVFCWISSIILGKMCEKATAGKMPKTLTQMYIHFLAHQITRMSVKYCEEQPVDFQGSNKVMMSLAKLAFRQMEEGNQIFYEDDLRACGIDVKEASVCSGLCTQVFREESWMQQKVFCFVHLSVQEFLAALYVHVMYKVHRVNLMVNLMDKDEPETRTGPVSELHKAAIDRALKSDNGHLDLFLRFLLGLSLDSSHSLLKALKIQVDAWDSHEETIKYIKEKINESLLPEKYINLFHCLNELNDHSLVEEIQNDLDLDQDSEMDEGPATRWAALVFVLLTSPDKAEEIQLKKYSRTETGLMRLLPAVRAYRSAMLNDCNLTSDSCRLVSSILSSSGDELSHLNLSDNNLKDAGVEDLCRGLQSPHCKLKTLRLNRCNLTQRCCEHLAAVLTSDSTHLQELDLSGNNMEDSGVELLCSGLGHESCKLEILRLSYCDITEVSCGLLASAVKSNPFHLRLLDLTYNHLGDAGPKRISEALKEAGCEFTKLRVHHNAEHWFTPGLKKYARELTLDINTAHKLLIFSDDERKVSQADVEQPYPDHPDRFDYWTHVLFQQGLTGRCYWEMEWEGKWAGVGMAYGSISRKGSSYDCVTGYNSISWGLHCVTHGYRAYHDFKSVTIPAPLAASRRLAVYLDYDGGTLSFYRVSPECLLTHLHTFFTRFSEPVFPVFKVWGPGSSLKLCPIWSQDSSKLHE